ncbi:MAG: cytidine deaminase [Chitinophagales bacterium]|jgi:cytidine deaminase|nr:cytidine deaminase [Saprospirales bacterium]MBP6659481.1 cytidine deaminase [Chitinophagales bacterium]
MKENLKFEINYIAYKSSDELPENYKLLVDAAKKATNDSYAPYSNFNVGAALFLNDGQIILGSNQENASYPIGFCAERTALSAAASIASHTKIKAIAITAKSLKNPVLTPAAPCGICRQTIFEAECKHHQNIEIILTGESGAVYIFKSIKDLLPLHFDADFL